MTKFGETRFLNKLKYGIQEQKHDLAEICLVDINIYELLLSGHFHISPLIYSSRCRINISPRLRVFRSWKVRAVPAFKILQIRERAGRDESTGENEKLSTKPLPSRRSCIYYTGRQYNATIMIRIKFTPCASRNSACRRRRTLRFGIESNFGSNPFGVRACVSVRHMRVCTWRFSAVVRLNQSRVHRHVCAAPSDNDTVAR